MNILFATWDGPQTDYLESLFLPIFAGLAQDNLRFHVLQFTWADDLRTSSLKSVCQRHGIGYLRRPVLRRPVAAGALASALWGKFAVRRAVRDLGIDVVMARSTLPALACMLAFRAPTPIRFVFDGDGLPHDERVDFGGWSPSGLSYRLLRDIEAQAVRRADAVITRTRAGRDILLARAGAGTSAVKFHVIGNSRDETLYYPHGAEHRRKTRQSLGIDTAAPVLVYSGSIGDQYCIAEMRTLFEAVRRTRPDASLLVLTGSPEAARQAFSVGPEAGPMIVRRVAPSAVPQYLGAADVALCLRRPALSTRAISPVKLGEYLLCGLPVVVTRGIGDIDRLAGSDAIHFLDDLSLPALSAAAAWVSDTVLPNHAALGHKSRELGLKHFALGAALQGYKQALAYGDRAVETGTADNPKSRPLPQRLRTID